MNEHKDEKDLLIDKFGTFMKNFKINKGEPYNYTSMGEPKGSWLVPDEALPKFYKLYRKMMKLGIPMHFTEKHKDFGPIVIDLDLKFDKKKKKRLYTEEMIEKIVQAFHNKIREYIDIDHDKLIAFVFEKKEPVLKKEKMADGLHILYPLICLKPDIQQLITEEVRDEAEENNIFEDLPLVNTMKEVFDLSIIDKTNWMIYGSYKPDGLPYLLTRIYAHDMSNIDPSKYDKKDLPTFLSIRKFCEEEIIEPNDNEETKAKLKKYKKTDKKKPAVKVDATGKIKPYKKVFPKTQNEAEEAERAKKLIHVIGEDRASDYQKWIRVGWCLHNISESLLDAWIEFSQKCPEKFVEGECEKLWPKFKDEGYGMGSLCSWAKDDNPGEYTEYKKDEINELLFNGVSGTNYDVAKVIFGLYRYQYVCASLKNKEWYEFKNHHWERIDEGYTLDAKISDELVNEFMKVASYFMGNVGRLSEAIMALVPVPGSKKNGMAAEDNFKRVEMVTKLTMKLKTTKFKADVMTECRKLFYDPNFYERLDENRNLIGFHNGVYDLKNLMFRIGTPDDYISFSTGIDFKEYDEDGEDFINVWNFMKQIQPKEEMRLYVLDLLASYLQGHVPDEKFHIWTGTGCHAWNTLIMLYSGLTKKVQDIKVGDQLMGDDSKPRNVLQLFRGEDDMYTITPTNEESFTVNKAHVLSLKKGEETIDIMLERYFKMDNREEYQLYKVIDGKHISMSFDVKYDKIDKYYGFELDGNHRYLDVNHVVHHNSNGKSKLIYLFQLAFGSYCDTLPITLLTRKRGSSNAASPEVAKTKGKRFCVFQEPEDDDRIHIGYMKELTGGDVIEARALFKEPVKFKPQFKLLLTCNKLPDIPSSDGGTWRRLRVVEFGSKFVDDPKKPNEYKKDPYLPDKLITWKEAFMTILIERFKVYVVNGLKEPLEVIQYTNKYRENSDVFLEFINEVLEDTQNEDDVMTLDNIYKYFSNWYKQSGKTGKKCPDRKELKTYLIEKRELKFAENKYYGIKMKDTGDADELEGEL